ncbi:hypothetical protein D6858_08685 [Tsuneonella suprasediminis]|uniref:Uncharacterized protein n=2 Tax=Tsuneonella suprasediminis TaxID=2306996 RepID=A0A419R2T4_9SPHN|nr:hypothetical protein D6858_08685 [Tsuneonella suprasediminis]
MRIVIALAALSFAVSAQAADTGGFVKGPVFAEFGSHAPVESDMPIPPGTEFKVAFDSSVGAKDGALNKTFESVARFINMNVAAGMPRDAIHAAVVVHGTAGPDLLSNSAWSKTHGGAANPNQPLTRALLDHGVRIILCGQSAARMGMEKGDLEPGVELALSAMTAHALLANEGYSENPF